MQQWFHDAVYEFLDATTRRTFENGHESLEAARDHGRSTCKWFPRFLPGPNGMR